MADTLTTTSGSGTQASTQSPQAAGGTATGTPSGNVQPGTAAALLNSTGGVPLQSTLLPTLSLNTPATATATANQPVPQKHLNTPLFGISILLFVIAGVLFWTTSRSEKNTT